VYVKPKFTFRELYQKHEGKTPTRKKSRTAKKKKMKHSSNSTREMPLYNIYKYHIQIWIFFLKKKDNNSRETWGDLKNSYSATVCIANKKGVFQRNTGGHHRQQKVDVREIKNYKKK